MIELFKDTFADSEFLAKVRKIALPVTLESILYMLTTLVDTVMIGRLGENAVAAVGLASKIFFIVTLVNFGVASGAAVLISQYWGVKDVKHICQVIGIGLIISTGCSLLLAGASFFMPEGMMSILTNSPVLIELGAQYLRIIAATFILQAISSLLIASLRCVEIARPAVVISSIAIVTNIFFNWCMIFGHCGFEAMGVKGAAIATLIARALELVLSIAALKISKSPLWMNIKYYFSFEKPVLMQFLKTSGPVVLNETLWGIGVSMPSLTYGRMGENVSAAMTIVATFQDIEVVGLKGLAEAAAVITGIELGMGHKENAKKFEKRFTLLAEMVALALAAFTLIIGKAYISIYDVQPQTAALVQSCLIVFAITLIWRGQNNIIYIGTLRAGGDTLVCMIMDIIPTWVISAGITPIVGLGLMWPLWAVFMVAQTDELVKFLFGIKRVRTYKWLKNLNTELTEGKSK